MVVNGPGSEGGGGCSARSFDRVLRFPSGWTLPRPSQPEGMASPPPPRSAVGFTEQEGYPPGSCLLPVGCPLAPLWSAASVSCRGEHDRFRPLPGCFVGHRCPHLERACRVAATLGQIIGGSSNRQSSEGDRYNRSNAGVLCDLGLSHDLFIRIRTGVHRTLG